MVKNVSCLENAFMIYTTHNINCQSFNYYNKEVTEKYDQYLQIK